MGTESIRVSTVLPATASRLYDAWLDAQEHSFMTGAPATVEAQVGGRHTAWGGYISGQTLSLEPGRRIVQSWRSTDFAEDDPDSRLEVRLEPVGGGTRVTIDHSNLPTGHGASLEEGWRQHYFAPMAEYFSTEAEDLSFQITESGRGSAGASAEPRAKGKRTTPAGETRTASKAKSAKTKTAKTKTAKATTAKTKTAKATTAKTKGAKTKAAKTKTAKATTAKAKGAKTKAAKTTTAKSKTAKPQTAKTKTARTKAAKTKGAKTKAAKTTTAKSKTAKPKTAKTKPLA